MQCIDHRRCVLFNTDKQQLSASRVLFSRPAAGNTCRNKCVFTMPVSDFQKGYAYSWLLWLKPVVNHSGCFRFKNGSLKLSTALFYLIFFAAFVTCCSSLQANCLCSILPSCDYGPLWILCPLPCRYIMEDSVIEMETKQFHFQEQGLMKVTLADSLLNV